MNTAAAGLDYGARAVVELAITPLLVNGLGAFMYGVWRILWEWTGYVWATSGRSAQALQSAIVNRQSSDDDHEKQQFVAASIIVWFLFLPLLIGIGAIGVWLVPGFVQAPPHLVGQIRWAAALLVGDAVAITILTIPRSVLQGENLGYKRMGLSAALVVGGGILTAVLVHYNAGIVGVAASNLTLTVVSGLLFLGVAKRWVPWFGLARPTRENLRWFLGLSGWFLAWKFVFEFMTSSDVLILGGLVSPVLVTVYVLTKFVADALNTILLMVTQGVTPGLGGILGAGDAQKAARIRGELMALTWLIVTAIGAGILAWNRIFVGLWVHEADYGGNAATFWILIMTLQYILIRNDTYLIDVTLRVKAKVIYGGISTAFSIGLACLLVGVYDMGIVGLCVGIVTGRMVLTIAAPVLVGRWIEQSLVEQLKGVVRPALVMAALFGAGLWVSSLITSASWLTFLIGGTLTVAAAGVAAAMLGLSPEMRSSLLHRVRKAVKRG